jgi:protein-L-isoaspartate(D-aspartate) O-methyltransferase
MHSHQENQLKLLMMLRAAGVRNTKVLAAMESIPREYFIMPAFMDKAYDDTALPIACGQTISQPSIVALMCEFLGPNDRLRVLEIGTGCGYQAAILSKIFRMVYTIERHESLYEQANKSFQRLSIHNITTRKADGSKGWPSAAPFERIVATAAAKEPPSALLDQLSAENGVMVIPVGEESRQQSLLRITRTSQGFREESLMQVRFVPLVEESSDS